ncbi:DNA oxidative demethylase ALKBH1 [Trichoplax sp. H2]|nr:DNA oxidative demethylase ALKBH1 [Trichoplax sp. H2]|eukprot:RDD42458.1 DNA oxidative demethylase ALKBH1 [Trichoplax sp. H2]
MSLDEDFTPPFRSVFKYYKRRQPPPDLSAVIDFHSTKSHLSNPSIRVNEYPLPVPNAATDAQCRNVGLKPIAQWQCYTIEKFPGFIYIRNPFLNCGQRYWIKRCLKNFHTYPSKTNLDAQYSFGVDENLWNISHYCCGNSTKGKEVVTKHRNDLMDKLRWTTLGYHYDWSTKEYYHNRKSEFPTDLAELTKLLAATVGFPLFSPEAAIINYYKLDSTLSGHTDHSEFDFTAPLFSISFGQKAIFLLGGRTTSVTPVAMYIESGDICIMSGESRLAYHAVPRIILEERNSCSNLQDGLQCECGHTINYFDYPCCEDCRLQNVLKNSDYSDVVASDQLMEINSSDATSTILSDRIDNYTSPVLSLNHDCNSLQTLWTSFNNYLLGGRINMNVRQVLPVNGKFPIKVASLPQV